MKIAALILQSHMEMKAGNAQQNTTRSNKDDDKNSRLLGKTINGALS